MTYSSLCGTTFASDKPLMHQPLTGGSPDPRQKWFSTKTRVNPLVGSFLVVPQMDGSFGGTMGYQLDPSWKSFLYHQIMAAITFGYFFWHWDAVNPDSHPWTALSSCSFGVCCCYFSMGKGHPTSFVFFVALRVTQN